MMTRKANVGVTAGAVTVEIRARRANDACCAAGTACRVKSGTASGAIVCARSVEIAGGLVAARTARGIFAIIALLAAGSARAI